MAATRSTLPPMVPVFGKKGNRILHGLRNAPTFRIAQCNSTGMERESGTWAKAPISNKERLLGSSNPWSMLTSRASAHAWSTFHHLRLEMAGVRCPSTLPLWLGTSGVSLGCFGQTILPYYSSCGLYTRVNVSTHHSYEIPGFATGDPGRGSRARGQRNLVEACRLWSRCVDGGSREVPPR
jgi:hypothetical protein